MVDEQPDDAATAATSADGAPTPLRAAVAIIGLECLALLVAVGVLVAKTVTGKPDEVSRALFTALIALAAAVGLAAGARALLRLSQSARTPVVVVQLLALPVSYSLAFQADRLDYGVPILLAALIVLFLLFTPPVRAVLDRDIHR